MTRILAIVGMILFGLTPKSVTVCSCRGISTIEEAYKNADFVGSGQVLLTVREPFPDSTKIKEMVKAGYHADSIEKSLGRYHVTKILIKTDKIYKGQASGDTVTIYTGIGGGDCGFRFIEGNKYIIFGGTRSYFGGDDKYQKFLTGQGIYWTNICTRTNVYYESEIKELEKFK
jgi:hypothetical protein